MGFIYQMQQFQEERLWGAISAVVGMERLIDQTVEYTRERKVFGRPLLDNQVIHFKLAELRTEVELVRSLCYRACEEYLEGTDVTMLASMAKLKAGRMLRRGDRRLPAILGRRGLSLGIADRARLPRFAPGLDRRRRRRGHAADHLQADGHPAPPGEPLSAGHPMAEFAAKYETLLLRRERSRLHVTLNRPEVKNALNPTLIGELRAVFEILRERRDIKVVILRGAGGTFCAGADLKNMEQSFDDKPQARREGSDRAQQPRIRQLPRDGEHHAAGRGRRRRGLRHCRRLRPALRLRRGDLHRGRGLRHERDGDRHRAGADRALRRRPHRRAADAASRADGGALQGLEALAWASRITS